MCEAFVWILLDSYKSTKLKIVDVQKSFIDNFQTQDKFELFNQKIEITKNDDDRVNSSSIQEFLKKKKYLYVYG